MERIIEKSFVCKDGMALARALVPESYTPHASFRDVWQSELTPFTASFGASSPDEEITVLSASKNIHYDVKNGFIKTIAVMVAAHTEAGYDRYEEPEEYMRKWAEAVAEVPLTLTGETEMPHTMGSDEELMNSILENVKYNYDAFLEMNSTYLDKRCEGLLYRFEGEGANGKIVVLAGTDYFCARLRYSMVSANVSENLGKAVDAVKKSFNIKGDSVAAETAKRTMDVLTGKEKLTIEDMKKGGLLGKIRRERENRTEETVPVQKEEVRDEKRPDVIIYGSARRYMCIAPLEREKEAAQAFLNFAATIQPDPSLDQRELNAISQKMAAIRQQAAVNQSIAINKQRELQRMQMETSRMIARNAQQASAGLMDSFNKKMASDSRISQGFSEATRGVESYTNSYGQSVDVGLAADHVYENRYGDVYGVSGSALDQSTLNELNWKEIKK